MISQTHGGNFITISATHVKVACSGLQNGKGIAIKDKHCHVLDSLHAEGQGSTPGCPGEWSARGRQEEVLKSPVTIGEL